MRLTRWPDRLPDAAAGAAVAIGNFDGVHLGHRAVLHAAATMARDLKAPLGCVTFEPHPRNVLQPEASPPRLTRLARKAELIRELGVEQLFVVRFNPPLMRLPPAEFVGDVLARGLKVRAVVAGHDFRFGHRRAGDVAFLRAAGERLGLAVDVVAPVAVAGEVCSSTAIRGLLRDGNVARAARLLGQPYSLDGVVMPGERRGRELGFPTANVHPGGRRPVLPGNGVYAVRAGLGRGAARAWHPAVANLGHRPTFDGRTLLLEVHLLEGGGDLYGQRMRVQFIEHLRGERRFGGIDELKAQIARDGEHARAIHARGPA